MLNLWPGVLVLAFYGGAAVLAVYGIIRLVRWAGREYPSRIVRAGLILLALLLIPTHLVIGEPFADLGATLSLGLEMLLYLLPSAGIVFSAALLVAGLAAEGTVHRRALIVGGLLLAKVLHNLFGLLAWDKTYDPLGPLWLVIPLFAAMIAGLLAASELAGRRRLAGLAFMVAAPAALFGLSAWVAGMDLEARTAANAQRMAAAVERYHARTGEYPRELAQLSPLYLLAHPRPWRVYSLDWCYDGRDDMVRLGYLDREHWSSPEMIARVVVDNHREYWGKLCEDQFERLDMDFPYTLVEE